MVKPDMTGYCLSLSVNYAYIFQNGIHRVQNKKTHVFAQLREKLTNFDENSGK